MLDISWKNLKVGTIVTRLHAVNKYFRKMKVDKLF